MSALTPGDPMALLQASGAGDYAASEITSQGDEISRRLFGDRWSVREVRRGGMGEVYICDSPEAPDLHVALKSFRRDAFFMPEMHRAFLRETLLWSRLSAIPSILPVIDVEHHDGRPFIVLPAVPPGPDGEVTLGDLLAARPLEGPEAIDFAQQLASAMAAATRRVPGLLHGDIKPSNLLVWQANLFVSDFGLARAASDPLGGELRIGTPGYRAPELDDPSDTPTEAADIYAVGVVIRELSSAVVGHDAIADALSDLAVQCAAENPADRPSDFEALIKRVNSLADSFSLPASPGLDELLDNPELRWLHQVLALPGWRVAMRHQQHEMVLDDIATIPEQQRNADVWTVHGSALSAAGRDDEALISFDHALAFPLAENERNGVLAEVALSLNHLGRNDEAIRILSELLRSASGERLEMVVVNLAGFYMDDGRPEAAVGLLRRHLTSHPDAAYRLHLQLGFACRDAGELGRAREAFQDAIARAPAVPETHVAQARLLMDHIGDIPGAAESVALALATGDTSEEMLTRGLICAQLLADADLAAKLHGLVEQVAGPARVEELLAEANRIITAADAEPEEPHQLQEPPESTSATDLSGWHAGAVDEPLPDSHLATEGPFMQQAFGLDGFYSVDFYDDVSDPEFVDELFGSLRTVDHHATASGLNATLRSDRLVFVRCTSCETLILTNRRADRPPFGCRRCGKRVPIVRVRRHDLDALTDEIAARRATGARPAAHDVVVIIQPAADDVSLEALVEIARGKGFERLDRPDLRLLLASVQAAGRKVIDPQRECAGVLRRVEGDSHDQHGGADAGEALVRTLRLRGGDIFSLSMAFSISDSERLVSLQRGDVEVIERELREAPANADTAEVWAWFSKLSMHAGQIENAVRQAQTAVRLAPSSAHVWMHLGDMHLELGEHEAALEALARARDLDPANRTVHRLLAQYHAVLGNEAEANAAATRAAALGADLRDIHRPT
jgi:tetratricopeptide (TPR) repeat protein